MERQSTDVLDSLQTLAYALDRKVDEYVGLCRRLAVLKVCAMLKTYKTLRYTRRRIKAIPRCRRTNRTTNRLHLRAQQQRTTVILLLDELKQICTRMRQTLESHAACRNQVQAALAARKHH